MWYQAENGSANKPSAIETALSSKYVYVRKNFVKIEEDVERQTPEHWTYLEQKISKEDWDTYQQVMTNKTDLTDVNAALIELAGIIGG